MITRALAASIAVQRHMVYNMNQTREGGGLGWNHPGFTDPNTGEPLTLVQMFDRHATCLAVCDEFGLLGDAADASMLEVDHLKLDRR